MAKQNVIEIKENVKLKLIRDNDGKKNKKTKQTTTRKIRKGKKTKKILKVKKKSY